MKKPIHERIARRTFPSVFQAWSPADNLPGEDRLTTMARHDLVFLGVNSFGLRWDSEYIGLGNQLVPESIDKGIAFREELLERNPNIILIAEIRYRDAYPKYLPENHKWWKRDKNGQLEKGWEEGGYIKLDFGNPEYRQHVAQSCQGVVNSGVVDGVMLDWWQDDDDRLELVQVVRDKVGRDAMIMANANDRITPRTAPYLNGYFMECTQSKTSQEWTRIEETLRWAEKNLKEPHINCLETWYLNSRNDLHLMRATTTLSLTVSDGYCLFSDPNPLPTPDHLHNWYDFWNKRLGKSISIGTVRSDGSITREFEKGMAIYNRMGNPETTINFDKPWTSVASGEVSRFFIIPSGDGDIFLKPGS